MHVNLSGIKPRTSCLWHVACRSLCDQASFRGPITMHLHQACHEATQRHVQARHRERHCTRFCLRSWLGVGAASGLHEKNHAPSRRSTNCKSALHFLKACFSCTTGSRARLCHRMQRLASHQRPGQELLWHDGFPGSPPSGNKQAPGRFEG